MARSIRRPYESKNRLQTYDGSHQFGDKYDLGDNGNHLSIEHSMSSDSTKSEKYKKSLNSVSPQSVTAIQSQNSRDLRRSRLEKQRANSKKPTYSFPTSLNMIFAAFWQDCCLYRHVLEISNVPTPTYQQLRNAYFRRGREVLSTPLDGTSMDEMTTLSLKDSSIMSSIQAKIPITKKAKMLFTAVSLCYEILSSPVMEKEYREYCRKFPPHENCIDASNPKTRGGKDARSYSSFSTWPTDDEASFTTPFNTDISIDSKSLVSGISMSTGLSSTNSILRKNTRHRKPGTKSSSVNSVQWNEEVEEIVILEGNIQEEVTAAFDDLSSNIEEAKNRIEAAKKNEKISSNLEVANPPSKRSETPNRPLEESNDEFFSVNDSDDIFGSLEALEKEVESQPPTDDELSSFSLWLEDKANTEGDFINPSADSQATSSNYFDKKIEAEQSYSVKEEESAPNWVKNGSSYEDKANLEQLTTQQPVWANFSVELDQDGWITNDAKSKTQLSAAPTGLTEDFIYGFDLFLGNYIKDLVSDMKTSMDKMGVNWDDLEFSKSTDYSNDPMCFFIRDQELDALMEILKTEIDNKINFFNEPEGDNDKITKTNGTVFGAGSNDDGEEATFWDDWIWNKS